VVSGAARGQGRAHALRLASEGADIVAFDVCEPFRTPRHTGATPEDLAETARLVEDLDRRCLSARVDARDLTALTGLAEQTMAEFGRVDALIVNHGIWAVGPNSWELEEADWQESIDVMLTGAWKVTKAFIPPMLEAGNGGSIVLTSSAMGKHAQLAWELGPSSIRVNAIMPGSIDSSMTQTGGTVEQSAEWYPRFFGTDRSLLPVGWMDPMVIANAAAFLVSDDAAFITGAALPVDAGWTAF
jgi:NAD(P)-dependent dehydrogenase (short-subunit alcohol dehydrogenase family)